jgi:hypothetical protein
METKSLSEPKSLLKLSKKNAVPAGKKPYAKPVLRKYGAVSELTNGGGCSKHHHDWNHTRKPWCW